MKMIIQNCFVSLFALAVAVLPFAGAISCPKRNDLIPHPSNCRYYYQCINYQPYFRTCGSTQHFNPGRRICTTPAKAYCTPRWRMLMRATAGLNTVNLYEAWRSIDQPINDDNCSLASFQNQPRGTYRSRWIDDWHLVSKVWMAAYDKGSSKMYVEFNAAQTNKYSFFQQSRITQSSYTDIKTSSYNYFSVTGHRRYPYNHLQDHDRKFYIWKNYGGCDADKGWFMVADLLHGPGVCSWEKRSIWSRDLPFFLYNPSNVAAKASTFKKADTFVLWGWVVGDYNKGCTY